MKIQLDTNLKRIKIEEPVNLAEFFTMIKKLLPNDLWKDFELETNVINNWTNPIVIKEYPIYPQNPYPLNPPFPNQPYWITCQSGIHAEKGFASNETTYNLKAGVFNIDCQAKN